jgi:hypothetical protein
VLILDEASIEYEPALKATLRELLTLVPPELLKGIRRIVFQAELKDEKILRTSGKVSSQYFNDAGAGIIHLYLANVDEKSWRLFPLSWRPWSRARRLAGALSYPLAHHRYNGRSQNTVLIKAEAVKIQAILMRRWISFWVNKSPVGPQLKEAIIRLCMRRMDRAQSSEGK